MGLKIQKSGFPPVKVLISKKLHIIRPAIKYIQQVSKPRKVRLQTGFNQWRAAELRRVFHSRQTGVACSEAPPIPQHPLHFIETLSVSVRSTPSCPL